MPIVRYSKALRSSLPAAATLALVFSLSGCAHTYQVKVEALRSPVLAPRQTYRLASLVEGREVTDPHYTEVATIVERALAAHGLHAASRPEWADIVVKIDYGISAIRLKPVPTRDSAHAAAASVFYPQKDGGPLSESVGVYVPGSALKDVVPVREKRLMVFARENTLGLNTGSDCGAELWRVEVGIEDESDSFEELLPVLAGTLVDYIDATSAPRYIERASTSAPTVVVAARES